MIEEIVAIVLCAGVWILNCGIAVTNYKNGNTRLMKLNLLAGVGGFCGAMAVLLSISIP